MRAWIPVLALALLSVGAAEPHPLLRDDFEAGLARWEIVGVGGVTTRDSGDPAHGRVMVLVPNGDVLALMRGSGSWGGVRVEGDVLFPSEENAYLGFVYAHRKSGERRDFGVVYIKGNGNYLLANPHHDFNVGRTLYGEYRTTLRGEAAIRIGRWQRFAFEVVGRTIHVYVGDLRVPQMTFSLYESAGGEIGLQPRSVGAEVWVDDVVARPIDALSYQGPPRPDVRYEPQALLTDWRVAGPLERTDDDLARDPDRRPGAWRRFDVDARGAVLTGRVADYHGPRTVAYFRAGLRSEAGGEAILHLSTADDLALWVNGRFAWFIERDGAAWFDFWKNPEHAGQRIPLALHPGDNDLILRVRGGVYASGGFFARIEKP